MDPVGDTEGVPAWYGTRRFSIKVPRRPQDAYWIYIAWGIDSKRPLYVGMSGQLWKRIGHHVDRSVFGPDVVEFECHSFSTEEEALAAEARAIHDLNPRWNLLKPLTPEELTASHKAYLELLEDDERARISFMRKLAARRRADERRQAAP